MKLLCQLAFLSALALPVAASAAGGEGAVSGFVFDDAGRPRAGVSVQVGDRAVVTDADGAFRVEIGEGTVPVRIGEHGVEIVVRGALTSEVLVTLPAQGPASFLSEEPAGDGPGLTFEGAAIVVPGRIVRDGDRAPIPGARVFVRGIAATATSDRDGRFQLELPPGTWDLSIVSSQYATQQISGVLLSDATTPPDLTVELVPVGLALDDFTIRAPKVAGGTAELLDERRTASAVTDLVGAEQMSRAGDNTAAAALRRVTGLTVVGGRYVFVRGLGERYSATLLNGSTLPSPEPERRVVPLDMFPASMLDSIAIQKTASPDIVGEFGGGVVMIRTRSLPTEPVREITINAAWRGGATFAKGPIGPRGPTDFLGIDGGFRAMPRSILDASADQPLKASGIFSTQGYTLEELGEFSRAVARRWDVGEGRALPDLGVQGALGRSWDTSFGRVGAISGLTFSNGWNLDDAARSVYSVGPGGAPELKRVTTYQAMSNRILLGGLLGLGAELGGGHEIHATTLITRVSDYEAARFDAVDPTGSEDKRQFTTAWVEQMLIVQQLRGQHPIGSDGRGTIDWRYALSKADRVEPDRREHTYELTQNGPRISQRGTWNEIAYVDLDEWNHDLGLDASWTVLPDRGTRPGRLKAGIQLTERRRTSDTRRYSFEFRGTDGLDLGLPLDALMDPANLGPQDDPTRGYMVMFEQTQNSDDYTAMQSLQASYAMVDLPIDGRLRAMAGARLERSAQRVDTFELFNPDASPASASLDNLDVLPSGLLTWAVGPKGDRVESMLLRASYGRTVSRPEFRELSKVPFQDFRTGVLFFGESNLKRATIDHIDARWEWYPRPKESVSLAAFAKRFDEPIERVSAISAVSGLAATFANADSATSVGIEGELRVHFDRLDDRLADWYFAANGAIIRSRVDTGGAVSNDTNPIRPLQGQAPWIANIQLGWDDPERGSNVALLYNATGAQLSDVGQQGVPDSYQLPVHQIDLVGAWALGRGWALQLRAQNLLDSPERLRTGPNIAERVFNGRRVQIGVQWRG
jgi:outer membrane receptor protein involved in Fe transport